MDPKHEPSPDDPNRDPQADKPTHQPRRGNKQGPPTGKHDNPKTDPMGQRELPPDSLVDLSLPGAATHDPEAAIDAPPPSGISVIEWASLVEDDPPSDTGSEPKIDAPSDADWLNQTLAPPQHRHPDLDEPTDDEPNIVPGSAHDLAVEEPDVLADDLEVVRNAFGADAAESKDRMKPAAEQPSHSGDVQYGREQLHAALNVESGGIESSQGVGPSDLAELGSTSGISGVNLVEEVGVSDTGTAAASGVKPAAKELVSDDMADAMLAAGEGSPAADEPHSGRDLIAEEVESGVDLRSPAMDIVEEEMEREAGQAGAAHSDPRLAGTVESAVIDGQLVEDVVMEDAGDSVKLGSSPKRQGTGSSVNLSGPPVTKKSGQEATGDVELGSASGNLVSSALDYTNVPELDGPTADPRSTQPLDSEEVDFGSDADVHLPPQRRAPGAGGDSDVLTEVETSPEVAEEEAASRKPAKLAKGQPARSGIVGWVGGGVMGAAVATGACTLVWLLGLLPGGASTTPPAVTRGQQVVQSSSTFVEKLALVRNGEFDKAAQAGIESIDEGAPDQLEARGENRWLSYVKQQRIDNKPLDPNDEPVKKALADFDKVVKAEPPAPPEIAADALFWTMNLHTLTNNPAEARKAYDEAVKRFGGDAALKRRFDVARIRLDLQTPIKQGGVGLLLPEERERLILITLLAPGSAGALPQPEKKDAGPEEAGYDFWEAVDLARKLNYAEALKKLQTARDNHDKRRFYQLRKSQNPTSDPNEDIFLRACDELKEYWQVQERLRAGNYLQAGTTSDKAVQGLIESAAGAAKWYDAQGQKMVAEKVIAKTQDLEQGIDKLLAEHKGGGGNNDKIVKLADTLVKEKVIAKPEELDAGIAKLLADRKTADAAVATAVASAKAGEKLAKEQMDRAAAAEAKLTVAQDVNNAVKKELVEGKYLEANASTDKLVGAVKDLVKVATTDNSKETVRKLQVELTKAQDQLAAALKGGANVERIVGNPLMAEVHYGMGLRLYSDKHYEDAEKEFATAIMNESQDARYHYYLGLTRLVLNKEGANAEFEQGALLEAKGRPSRAAVSKALERVQGPVREVVNEAREKVR